MINPGKFQIVTVRTCHSRAGGKQRSAEPISRKSVRIIMGFPPTRE